MKQFLGIVFFPLYLLLGWYMLLQLMFCYFWRDIIHASDCSNDDCLFCLKCWRNCYRTVMSFPFTFQCAYYLVFTYLMNHASYGWTRGTFCSSAISLASLPLAESRYMLYQYFGRLCIVRLCVSCVVSSRILTRWWFTDLSLNRRNCGVNAFNLALYRHPPRRHIVLYTHIPRGISIRIRMTTTPAPSNLQLYTQYHHLRWSKIRITF